MNNRVWRKAEHLLRKTCTKVSIMPRRCPKTTDLSLLLCYVEPALAISHSLHILICFFPVFNCYIQTSTALLSNTTRRPAICSHTDAFNLLGDEFGEKKDSSQTDGAETEMKSVGGEPCLYMHGWWKNVSLNGSQLSTALRTAKTRQGNKIWDNYWYTAITNYPPSPTVSFCAEMHTCHTD